MLEEALPENTNYNQAHTRTCIQTQKFALAKWSSNMRITTYRQIKLRQSSTLKHYQCYYQHRYAIKNIQRRMYASTMLVKSHKRLKKCIITLKL